MSILDRWLTLQPSRGFAGLAGFPGREKNREREQRIERVFSFPANPANPQTGTPPFFDRPTKRPRWIDRPDVVTVVEDLADEGKMPGQVSRLLGLTRAEVVTILRRTAR
ncbi:MAG: hypothetical protein ACREJ5_17095 [Geminicoccaceae bacterium]